MGSDRRSARGLVLDGELIVWDTAVGRLLFQALQRRAATRARGALTLAARWSAFFVAFRGGMDRTHEPGAQTFQLFGVRQFLPPGIRADGVPEALGHVEDQVALEEPERLVPQPQLRKQPLLIFS